MLTTAQQANSIARVKILADMRTWAGFDQFFNRDWRAKEIREKLAYADVYLPLVGEWAILSFHELAKEEAQWKREQGEDFKIAQRTSIDACNRVIRAYGMYAAQPEFAPELTSVNIAFGGSVSENKVQLARATRFLDIAENTAVFKTRRLGSNWNCLYLKLLKECITFNTRWDQAKVMSAMTYLAMGAHEALKRPTPVNLRMLLQKALRNFEENPENGTINYLATMLIANPVELERMFPKVRPYRDTAA